MSIADRSKIYCLSSLQSSSSLPQLYRPEQKSQKLDFISSIFDTMNAWKYSIDIFAKTNSLTRNVIKVIDLRTGKPHIPAIATCMKGAEEILCFYKLQKDITTWNRYFTATFFQKNLDHVAAEKSLSNALMSPIYAKNGIVLLQNRYKRKCFASKIIEKITADKNRGFYSCEEARAILKKELVTALPNVEFEEQQLNSVVKSVVLKKKRHSTVVLLSLLTLPISNALKCYTVAENMLTPLFIKTSELELKNNAILANIIGGNTTISLGRSFGVKDYISSINLIGLGFSATVSTCQTTKAIISLFKESLKPEDNPTILALKHKNMRNELIKLASIGSAFVNVFAPYVFDLDPLEIALLAMVSKSIGLICTFAR